MIERLAWRTAGFAGTTAQRAFHAVEELLPGVHPPARHQSRRRGLPTVAGAVAALALGVVSARSRDGAAGRGAAKARSKATGLAEKSRQELYELARDADIPGRSNMTKNELARALSR